MTRAADAAARLIGGQRWFGSKARPLAGGCVIDAGDLPEGCVFALYEVEFADGGSELYQLPHRIEGDGALELSLADPVLGASLLTALRQSAPVRTREGRLEFELLSVLPDELAAVRAIGGEQSNSSIVFGERVILKAYRRLEAGESVELELLRALAAHGFAHMPPLLGWYRYAGASLEATLGVLQAFVPGARDGWSLALESFADPSPFHASLERLGAVTARMHNALAGETVDPAFRPEPLDASALARASEAAEADARAVLDDLVAGGPAEAVRAHRDDVLARLAPPDGDGGQSIRQHGDYHLGQVLWAGRDWQVLDFEGEPARPLAERRRKTTPLRDVAGMLRSLAYAAETSRSLGEAVTAEWEQSARAAFLAGYETEIDQSLLPADPADRAHLLAACELEKALYELSYELNNRPAWVGVPVAGIERLLNA